MKIAGLQIDIVWEDPEANFRRLDEQIARAVEAKARLVVLPEMFATGFTMDAAGAAAAAKPTREFLSRMALRYNCWLLGGFVEPAEAKPHNVCTLMNPRGEEAFCYRKIHPFTLAGEDRCYSAGESLAGCTVEGVRVTPFICYDLRFPEPFRAAAAATDLFVVIANWPEPRAFAWRTLLVARAIENQCYVLGVNRVGEDDGKNYRGDSAIIDPMGDTLTSAEGTEQCLVGEVNPDRVKRTRKSLSFLADRRPAIYRTLEEEEPD